MSYLDFFNSVYFSKIKLFLKPKEDIFLPKFKGSTIRGGFGYIFKKLSCPLKSESCLDCFLLDSCPYANVFVNPVLKNNKTFLPTNSYAPHPFVIDLDFDKNKLRKNHYKNGEVFNFDMVIIGKALNFLSYFIYTFIELGKKGIGKKRGKYELISVRQNNNNIYECSTKKINREKIKLNSLEKIIKKKKNKDILSNSSNKGKKYSIDIEFITPTRIKHKGKYIDSIDFNIFITNLLRRIYLLNVLFCTNKKDNLEDFVNLKDLIEESKKIITQTKSLNWYDWERYSTRQNSKMKLGGIIGKVSFVGRYENLLKFFPLILLGEKLHIGKGTSFGLGRYRILDFKEI